RPSGDPGPGPGGDPGPDPVTSPTSVTSPTTSCPSRHAATPVRLVNLPASDRCHRSFFRMMVIYAAVFLSHSREQQDGCSRGRPAVRLPAQGTHRAGLAALPRLGRRDRSAVGVGAVAAGALREERPAAAPGGRARAVRGVLRRSGAGPA